MSDAPNNLLKKIPAVGALLASPGGLELRAEFGNELAAFAIRSSVGSMRKRILGREPTASPEAASLLASARSKLEHLRSPASREAVNAAGIVLHTGLGRSPLCAEALDAMQAFGGYSLLEIETETGNRGKREEFVERILIELTGCEAACVVNNNASATFIILRALAEKKEVVVSRGQLVEIGGSFRMPDVMAQSGAVLREVGTTNRTYVQDYEGAINERTGALMHVHQSNYRIHGFTAMPTLTELCEVGRRRGIPVIDDIGSGALVPLARFGIPDEPLVRQSIEAGCDVVCFSGDKLISGPQSGIIIGRKEMIARVRKDPFFRILRPDKMLLAALEATLLQYLDWPAHEARLPLYRILGRTTKQLEASAKAVIRKAQLPESIRAEVIESESFIGGGAVPDHALPGRAVKLSRTDDTGGRWAEAVAAKLRLQTPAVFGRIKEDAVLLEMRCLVDGDEKILSDAITAALREDA